MPIYENTVLENDNTEVTVQDQTVVRQDVSGLYLDRDIERNELGDGHDDHDTVTEVTHNMNDPSTLTRKRNQVVHPNN